MISLIFETSQPKYILAGVAFDHSLQGYRRYRENKSVCTCRGNLDFDDVVVTLLILEASQLKICNTEIRSSKPHLSIEQQSQKEREFVSAE
jgi:hypothetical protein